LIRASLLNSAGWVCSGRFSVTPRKVPGVPGVPKVLMALVPLVLLGALLAAIVWSRPADAVRGVNVPPIERLTFQRVTLEPGAIVATVMNDGPDDITIAQVQVDEAYWTF